MLPHIAEILEAARLAPSRDNLQPWRFHVDGEAVSFAVDAERDPSPMNAGGRMARIALGAALESALIRAGRMGATVRFPEARPGAVVTVTFSGAKRVPPLDKGIERRATNRLEYDGRAVDDETFTALRDATPALDGVRAHWFGRERVRVLAPIVEDAVALLYGNATARAATFAAMRFDARDREEVSHGLSIGSLDLSAATRIALDELRRKGSETFDVTRVAKKIAAHERKLVESASGVCFFTTSGDAPIGDVNVGRTLQRAWLTLTRRGLVAQPISAVAAVEAILALDDRGTLAAAETLRATLIREALAVAVPSIERGSRIGIALRFGWAHGTTARVGRRALEESVHDSGSTLMSPPTSMPPPSLLPSPPSPPPPKPSSDPSSDT